MKKITVAIDGYSSSGKSTMAKALARAVGYAYIDSGAMYRAVTLYAMRHGLINADGRPDEAALAAALPGIHIDFRVPGGGGASHTFLDGEDVEAQIRSLEVSSHVSPVAALPEVRHALTRLQREYGKAKGIVMDGRDIGTTVFPDAEMKVFVDATPQERARRRFRELTEKGDSGVTYDQVLANVLERDEIDRTRKESPLRQADDAVVLCNDAMTADEQDRWMLDLFHKRTAE